MAKQKRDAVATKAKIISSARFLFSKYGYDATTIDDIARESGCNKALLYYYFKNKAGLYEEVMSGIFDAVYDAVIEQEKSCTNEMEKLEVFINAYASYAYKNPYFPALLLRELSDSGAHVPEMMFESMRKVFLLLSSILKRGEEQKVFRKTIPMVVHFMILGTINLMITTTPLRQKTIFKDEALDTCGECGLAEVSSYLFETLKKSLEV
jgi:AcrR family transcriptional regulator